MDHTLDSPQSNNHPSRRLVSVAIGGVPIFYPPGHPLAGQIIEFSIRVPGAYTINFGRAPRCAEFHLDVGDDRKVRFTLIRFGRHHVAGVEKVQIHDDQRFRRARDILFGDGRA